EMAEPPVSLGGDQEILAEPSPALAVTDVGWLGTVSGTTAFDTADSTPVPATLVAATVKVYEAPLVSPPTAAPVAGAATVSGPGAPGPVVVIRYDVIAAPPLSAGTDQVTTAEELAAAATTPVGAPGTVRGTTAADAGESGPVPTALVAATLKV